MTLVIENEEVRQIKYEPLHSSKKPDKPKPRNTTIKADPKYGCLKNGKKPTYRAALELPEKPNIAPTLVQRQKTSKVYNSFGKNLKNATVRVLIKDQKTIAAVDREKKKLEKHPLSTVCDYLAKRNLYQAGSNAPEDILRQTYINAHLAGNVYNNNDEIMMRNYMSSAL
jgi:hypothetical protein